MTQEDELKNLGLENLKISPWRKSLGQHVFESLKSAIIRGDIPPGNRIVESRIAGALGISRTPVREAIHKLEREGLLHKPAQGGLVVIGLNRDDIEETFGIRSVLESYAARLAADKHHEGELNSLEDKIEEYQACLQRGRLEELTRVNTEFHDLLYALSRSPKLIKLINDLRDQIYRFRQVLLREQDMATTSNKDHQLMLQFIRRRDGDGVEKLVREHILRGRRVVLEKFDAEGLK
jgi:DNA-binding GntR family transcriptional regulator